LIAWLQPDRNIDIFTFKKQINCCNNAYCISTIPWYNNIPYYSAYSWFNPALRTVHYYPDSDLFNPAHTSTPRGAYSPYCRNQRKGLISHKAISKVNKWYQQVNILENYLCIKSIISGKNILYVDDTRFVAEDTDISRIDLVNSHYWQVRTCRAKYVGRHHTDEPPKQEKLRLRKKSWKYIQC
jgi:hypothetical protein